MAKAAAPTSLTGGQGFNFEGHVAARFLIGLLGASHPLDTDLGQLARVVWLTADLFASGREPEYPQERPLRPVPASFREAYTRTDTPNVRDEIPLA